MTVEPVHGSVLDERGRGIGSLVVLAHEELLGGLALAGEARTRPDGSFEVDAPRAEALLAIYDRAGIRRLVETRDRRVVIPRRLAEGWLVTDFFGQPAPVARGNRVEWLIDGSVFFGETLQAIRRAKRSIHLMQLLLKDDLPGAFEGDDAGRPVLILDALIDATRRGVDVRVLLNENAVVPDDVDEVRLALRARGGSGLAIVRGFPMSPGVMHAKLTIVDGEEALVIGPPGEPRWWDTPAHSVEDARRGRGQPMHDAGFRVRGPMVAQMGRLFADLWNLRDGVEAGPRDRLPPPPEPQAAGSTALQAARTVPAGLFAPDGEATVLQAHERALANAEDFAFLETQYFTSPRASRALSLALRHNPKLEVVLVLNNHMDVPLGHYDRIQRRRLAEVGWPDHPRVGVFSLVTYAERPGRRPAARDVYVHTKAAVVDDKWATMGSANLDGYSLDSADEFGLVGVRSLEWNLLVLDGVEGEPESGAARDLRVSLWSEELGLPRDTLAERPREGWLAMWRRLAAENQTALADGKRPPHGFALPHLAPTTSAVDWHAPDFNLFNRPRAQREGI